MSNTVYIYTKNMSNRLAYTCELLFKTVLGIDYKWIKHLETPLATINYSDKKWDGVVTIRPHKLLFETDLKSQDIAVIWRDGIPYFLKTDDEQSINYDIFASTFYMATRYEEYLSFEADKYGRFSAKQALAYKAGFLHLPVVHLWANVLKETLQKVFPNLNFPKSNYKQINTVDIDVAYAFRGKPILRQMGNLAKSVLTFDFNEIKHHWNYWMTGNDYLDTYAYIEKLVNKSSKTQIFFFEVGNYAKYDRNIPLNDTYQSLIKQLSKIGNVGIHPSYQSNDKPEQLPELIRRLQAIIDAPITISRQHFLRLRFPETYERLIENGISKDYSMGFSDAIGFRAGLCVPYPFFNLKINEKRPLTIVPFQVMDGTLKDYMNLSVNEAKTEVLKLKQQVKNVNGTFISIFHNSSLTNQDEWLGWRAVYEALMSE